MGGEQNISNVALAAASVPSVPGAAVMEIPTPAATRRPRVGLAPYEATTRWRPWPAFGALLVILAVSIIVGLGGGLLLVLAPDHWGISRNAMLLGGMLFGQVLIIAGTLIAARGKGDRLFDTLALKAPVGGFRAYAGGLVVMLAAVGVYSVVTDYIFKPPAGADLAEVVDLFRSSAWPLGLIAIGIGAPLSEELMFRGFLQTALVHTRLGYWGAALATTSVWTTLHIGYSLVGLVEVFMIGMVFALLLRRTGSLRVTLACHAIYNSGIALALIFAPKELLGF